MKSSVIYPFLLLPMLVGSLAEVDDARASSANAKRFIERGDRLFAKRGQGERWVRRAMECYEKTLAVDTRNTEASWRFARASYWIGIHVDDPKKSIVAYRQAIDLTKRAVAIDPRSVANHFWLGVCLAKYGEAKGVLDSVGLVEPIRKQMRVVIELDESFAGGGAHRLLGWMEYKLPGVLGGSEDRAIEHLDRAVELRRSHLLNHLCLAEIHRSRGSFDKAKKHLRFILEAPYEKDRRPENELEKSAAKDMLEQIEEQEKS
jgi:tetratricopeptide (TPR) repeat protein